MEISFIIDYLVISIVASIAINLVLRDYARHKNLLVDLPEGSAKEALKSLTFALVNRSS